MTILRARELLGLENLTDEEVMQVIADGKKMCRILLKSIVKENSLLTETKASN